MKRSARSFYSLGDPAQSVASQALGDQLRSMLETPEDSDDGEEKASETLGSVDEAQEEPGEGSPPDEVAAPSPGAQQSEFDRAARLLLTKVPAHVATFIEEQSRVYTRYPIWTFVMGAVLRQYEASQLQAPILDPTWIKEFNSLDPGFKNTVCRQCGQVFKEKNYGQKFCTNECGMKHESIKSAVAAEAARAHRDAERARAEAARLLV